jgi:hypothetical protein
MALFSACPFGRAFLQKPQKFEPCGGRYENFEDGCMGEYIKPPNREKIEAS